MGGKTTVHLLALETLEARKGGNQGDGLRYLWVAARIQEFWNIRRIGIQLSISLVYEMK